MWEDHAEKIKLSLLLVPQYVCFFRKVLQRIYLFSDSQGDVDPEDVIDLKDVAVAALADA